MVTCDLGSTFTPLERPSPVDSIPTNDANCWGELGTCDSALGPHELMTRTFKRLGQHIFIQNLKTMNI